MLARAWLCLVLGACQAHAPDSGLGPASEEHADDAGVLPSAFKGYELYAWEDSGQLSFTLITGTNRQKTLAEVTAESGDVIGADWVFVHGQGMPALRKLLERVPDRSSVALMPLEGLGPLSEDTRAEIMQALSGS
ncbi:MAG: hypothetical protein QM778_38280 [Myxococcales bacterium]